MSWPQISVSEAMDAHAKLSTLLDAMLDKAGAEPPEQDEFSLGRVYAAQWAK